MLFSPLYLFLFAGLFSPGPNVILLLSSGARFGARATWPHIIGVTLGGGMIGGLVGFGVGQLLLAAPNLTLALKIIAATWITWMAYSLWKAKSFDTNSKTEKPFTIIQGILFQWVNPKLWAVATAASAGYGANLSPSSEATRLMLGIIIINFFACICWAYFGETIARFLKTDRAWIIFRRIMAVFLFLSALLVFR